MHHKSCACTLALLCSMTAPLFAAGIDSDLNGVWDNYDENIKRLPSAEMRVAGQQVAAAMQAIIAMPGEANPSEATTLGLNWIIATECFGVAAQTTGSTIRPEMFNYALTSVESTNEQRDLFVTNLSYIESYQQSDSINIDEFESTYNRLSPLSSAEGQPACDHLATEAPDLPLN